VLVVNHSIFRRATRYPGPENRLTEILASVLERVPEAGQELACVWTDPHQETAAAREVAWPLTSRAHEALTGLPLRSVRTQIRTPKGKRIDLALRFGPQATPSTEDVLIWVEDKLAANPHHMQLVNYRDDLPVNVHAAAVVLLAPRSSLPYATPHVPDGVAQRSWQETGRQMRLLLDTNRPDAVKAFLLKELIAYMREENLTDPEAIRPEHLVALAYADHAEAGLERICEEASRFVEREWGEAAVSFSKLPRLRKDTPAFGWNYWESWRLNKAADGNDVSWLDWNARNEVSHPEAEGRSLFFMSGLTAGSHENLAPTEDQRRRHERLQAGVYVDGRLVRFQRVSDDYERLTRIAFPEEVLIGRTIEAQATALGAWIVDGFRALTLPLQELESPAVLPE
jgi:hypothetical protein